MRITLMQLREEGLPALETRLLVMSFINIGKRASKKGCLDRLVGKTRSLYLRYLVESS